MAEFFFFKVPVPTIFPLLSVVVFSFRPSLLPFFHSAFFLHTLCFFQLRGAPFRPLIGHVSSPPFPSFPSSRANPVEPRILQFLTRHRQIDRSFRGFSGSFIQRMHHVPGPFARSVIVDDRSPLRGASVELPRPPCLHLLPFLALIGGREYFFVESFCKPP